MQDYGIPLQTKHDGLVPSHLCHDGGGVICAIRVHVRNICISRPPDADGVAID